MIGAVVAAVAAVLAVAGAGPLLARRLPPRWAVWLLTVAMAAAAASGVFVLGVVAFLWVGQLDDVADQGSWSVTALARLDPIARGVSIAAGLLLLPAAAWTIRTILVRTRQVRVWYRIERDLPGRREAVSVLDTPDVDAFTLPSGRVVVTSGLLSSLTDTEHRIVLAHERSHGQHQHTWWKLAVDLAAAVNPLLRPTARAVADMTERWADEDATRVATRHAVAMTMARVALLRAGHTDVAPAAVTGGQVPQRVRALLAPPPRTRPGHLLALVALLAVLAWSTFAVEQAGETVFEHAMHATATATARR